MQSTFRYDVLAGTAADTYAGTGILTFTDQYGRPGVSRIMQIGVWDNGAFISLSYDGVTFGDDIEVDQDDPPVQIPHAAAAVQIRNATAGLNSRYQIIGFW